MLMPNQIKPKNNLLHLAIFWVPLISLTTFCLYLLKVNHDLNKKVKKKEKKSNYKAIEWKEEGKDVSDFFTKYPINIDGLDEVTKINVKNYNLQIIHDPALQQNRLTISGDKNNFSDIRYKIENSCLYITTKQNVSYESQITIECWIKEIDKLKLSGRSHLVAKSQFYEQQNKPLSIKLLDFAKIGTTDHLGKVKIPRIIKAEICNNSACRIIGSKDITLTIFDNIQCSIQAGERMHVIGSGNAILKVVGDCTLTGAMKGNSRIETYNVTWGNNLITFDNKKTQSVGYLFE
jgi:hypothetical protein